MGWDTKIIIIAESIELKEEALKIGKEIFESDSKSYGKEAFYLIETSPNFAIYFTYERRKYAPYWIIQEISKKFPNVLFTVLGSSLEFLCGPGGIIRIQNGTINDSYGIDSENSFRQEVLFSPIENRQNIYEWFKSNGKEEKLRSNHVKEFPIKWCDGNYSEKIIPVDEVKFKQQIENNRKAGKSVNWERQKPMSEV